MKEFGYKDLQSIFQLAVNSKPLARGSYRGFPTMTDSSGLYLSNIWMEEQGHSKAVPDCIYLGFRDGSCALVVRGLW